jgi:diguanylate cyclase (GGDEF)-like protein
MSNPVGFGTHPDTVEGVRDTFHQPSATSRVRAAEPTRVIASVGGPLVVAELTVAALNLSGIAALAVRLSGWVLAATLVMTTVVRPLLTELATARMASQDSSVELHRVLAEQGFRDRVERALAQTAAEPAAMRAALRAAHELRPDAEVTLLLAVPDEPRVGWSVRLAEDELLPARPIPDTPGCAALAGNTVVAIDSSALDACEHLDDPDMAVSASCIPLRLGDRVLGVVSILQAPGERPDDHTLELLEWLVGRTGTRITELRRLQGRRSAFREDAVTGLPGPDALDSHLRESFRSLVPFCVALVDIDDFEGFDHLWTDETIDDALRTIAESLRLTLRPDDVVCRIDRGRFAVLLGNCGAVHASLALERVRESLALSLSVTGSTPFTFSAGVVESHRAISIEDLLDQARSATRLAHGNGGNRVALAHD